MNFASRTSPTVVALLLALGVLVLPQALEAGTPLEAAVPTACPMPAVSGDTALAAAFVRRARATADAACYAQADAAIARVLARAPDDYAALRARAAVLLGQHDYAAALHLAEALHARFPDDIETYVLMIDAALALGQYTAAERTTQALLDLRPADPSGLIRAALLREVYGDDEGAIDIVAAVLMRSARTDAEERAWLFTQLARLQLEAGHADLARQAAASALAAVSEYPGALAELARIARACGSPDEWLAAEERHHRAAPSVANLYWLARARMATGRKTQAEATFREFATAARAAAEKKDNANIELVLYTADEGAQPAVALALAERELGHRQDLGALTAHAWASYRCCGAMAAIAALQPALALGSRDIDFVYAAGEILAASGASARALDYLHTALALAPADARAPHARALLPSLVAAAARQSKPDRS